MTLHWPEMAQTQDVVQIGQIPPEQVRELRRMARKGLIREWRGCWDTKSPAWGLGRLKTWWGPIEEVGDVLDSGDRLGSTER